MSNELPKRRFNVKGFTSLVLTIAFLIVTVSGVCLYASPRGRVANWTDWTLLGLGKHDWSAVHMNSVVLFLIAAVFHLIWNWTMFWGYIKKRAGGLNLRLEMFVALVIGLVFVSGPLRDLPPFSSLVAANEAIKNYWEQQAAESPFPHADEASLTRFADTVGLPVDDLIETLKQEGFTSAAPDVTVGQIASDKGVAPSELFAALREHYPEIDQPQRGHGMGRGQGQGMGRGQGGGRGEGRGRGEGMGRGPGGGRGQGMGGGRGRGQAVDQEVGEEP
ncbi:MAG: DUF4405 domain-containing protein [Pirellulaceae bacterium]|nr:DUF4405 domain-containing protein [Pirellulaceae bacterium]